MKFVYCTKCKMPIEVIRKALPKYSKVIDAIDPHTCQTSEDAEWQFPVNPAPTFTNRINNEIVKNLNDLDDSIGDRRPPENVKDGSKSSAPPSLLKQIRGSND